MSGLQAQKILKIYRGGNAKTIDFRIGDELHFRLKDSKEFYVFKIKDLDFATNTIWFENGDIPIKNIVAIKSFANYQTANVFQKMLYTFGGAWLGYSVADIILRGEEPRRVIRDGVIVAGISVVTGYLLKKLWGVQIYRFDTNEYFLGIVDLNIKIDP